jgi:hypothetical protein
MSEGSVKPVTNPGVVTAGFEPGPSLEVDATAIPNEPVPDVGARDRDFVPGHFRAFFPARLPLPGLGHGPGLPPLNWPDGIRHFWTLVALRGSSLHLKSAM